MGFLGESRGSIVERAATLGAMREVVGHSVDTVIGMLLIANIVGLTMMPTLPVLLGLAIGSIVIGFATRRISQFFLDEFTHGIMNIHSDRDRRDNRVKTAITRNLSRALWLAALAALLTGGLTIGG